MFILALQFFLFEICFLFYFDYQYLIIIILFKVAISFLVMFELFGPPVGPP